MKHLIRKCPKCNSYTLKFSCEKCKVSTMDAHPARYSPDDKYALYRIADRYIHAGEEPVKVDQENNRK
ncbi:MAG: RNA-protein complex protein Nop10 [Candidatus Nitrosopolaris sp.]